MKKTLLIILSILLYFNAKAQTNWFPPDGNVGIGTTNPVLWFNPYPTLAIEGMRPTLKMNTTDPDGLATIVFRSGSDNSTFSNDEFHINYRPYHAQNNPIPSITISTYFNNTGGILNLMGNGNVGIGTNSPSQKLEVVGNITAGGLGTYWQGFRSNGLTGTWGFQQNDIMMVGIGGNVYDRGFSANAMGIFNGSTTKEDIYLYNQNTGSGDFLVLKNTGNVGIGTITPAEKLSVNGKIRAHEIKVETTNWPDYVFEEEYKPASLQETEAYIKTHKHLPEIPSAQEAEANGISLGEMNAKLLKKIEELTLHMIEQSKELKVQSQKLNDQEQKVEEQSKLIAAQQKEINQLKKH